MSCIFTFCISSATLIFGIVAVFPINETELLLTKLDKILFYFTFTRRAITFSNRPTTPNSWIFVKISEGVGTKNNRLESFRDVAYCCLDRLDRLKANPDTRQVSAGLKISPNS